ncbi:hypothetical protein AAKU55_004461 [Oxalobacteraceae bacterium GrIS 1.11]
MTNSNLPPSFWRRIPLAFGALFNILSDADYALRVARLDQAPAPAAAAPRAPANQEAALQLLSLLQREARLIDFTQENLSAYADADIGAAARVVHEGCGKVLREHFTIEAVRAEAEGSRIVLEEGFDAAAVRLTGNVVGGAPFRGSLSHRGWRASGVRLPKLSASHDATILAPAEVEL